MGNVENRGRIETGDSGIEFSGTTFVEGAVINRGTILTTEYGIYITDDTTVDDGVLNAGRIDATDDHGIRISSGAIISAGGVVLDAGSTTRGTTGLSISDASVTGNIINNGIIEATDSGIVIRDASTLNGSIVGGGSSFITNGIEPSPWVVHSGVGITYDVADHLDFTVRYDREDRGEFDVQTASIRLQQKF